MAAASPPPQSILVSPRSANPNTNATLLITNTAMPTTTTHPKSEITSLQLHRTPKPTTPLTSFTFHNESSQTHATLADTLASTLQQCASALSLRFGTQIHAQIFHLGLSHDLYLSSQLLYFYCLCAQPDSARTIFDSITPSHLNTFFWNVMIRSYTTSSQYANAIQLFSDMLFAGFRPNQFTFPFVLDSCSHLGFLHLAQQIHALMVVAGFQHDVFAASALLDVYTKWGCLGDACKLFDRIPEPNVVTWNLMICAYAQSGFWVKALEVLDLMGELGHRVDASSWNSIIAGCVRRGDGDLALEIVKEMLVESSIKPNLATFNTLLPAIPTFSSLVRLKEFHGFTTRWQGIIGIESVDDERSCAAIAAGYAYHGCMIYASRLFNRINSRTTQLWNSMISGYIDCGLPNKAFCIFREMVTEFSGEFKTLSKVPLTLLLPECSPSFLTGLEIHAHAYRIGLESNLSVNNALIAMYIKRGDIELSERVFQRTLEKDVISWNTMVSGYARLHDFDQAFDVFRQMHSEDMKPDEFTFSSVLSGCGHSAALRQGMGVHGCIIKSGFSEDYCIVHNSLVDMYGKCGSIEEAEKAFDEMTCRDDVSWNTMISCYGANARPHEAFSLFEEMQEKGWKPNRVTFIALLSACSHAGLVDEGLHCFKTMYREHGVIPDVEHYACVIDNLGRAGRLDEAYRLIKSMPIEPDDCIWGALLAGCRIHGNIPLAEVAARYLTEMEPQHSGYHVLLSNVYADARRWDDVDRVRAVMKSKGVIKFPGCSWIDVSGELHTFLTADKSHRECLSIYLTLDGLTEQLKVEGYVPTMDIRSSSLDQLTGKIY
ncbi:pentatricopeptide repeat-containing protein At3g16610-like [Tasmannia lanceolata]|uniref:pentatricopeptide repeat-containing protein At3g16610-like n=1 Tax=Tasmannia lanceolata TaxID=3420 RepID=UPI004063B4F6